LLAILSGISLHIKWPRFSREMNPLYYGLIIGITIGILIGICTPSYIKEGFQTTAGSSDAESPSGEDIVKNAFSNIDLPTVLGSICSTLDSMSAAHTDRIKNNPEYIGKKTFVLADGSSSGSAGSSRTEVDLVTYLIDKHTTILNLKKKGFGCP